MPWHKVENHADCPAGKPWAVVKDSDGSVEACHANESDANDHMAALYANESGSADEFGGKPNPGTPEDKRLKENKPGDSTCPPGQKADENGKCVPIEKMAGDSETLAKNETTDAPVQTSAPWSGVLCVEGVTTGDGREFSPESLTWSDLPIPL